MDKKYTVKYAKTAYKLNFTEDKTNLAVGLMHDNFTRYEKPELFELSLSLVKRYKNNGSKIKEHINLIPCKKEFFDYEVEESFTYLNLSNYWCAEDRTKLISQGGETDNFWEYIEWSVKIKEGIDTDLVKDWLDTYPTKIATYYPEIHIDQNNMSHPVTKTLKPNFFFLSYHMYKKEFFDFAHVLFQKNDDRALDVYHTETFVSLLSQHNDGYFISDRQRFKRLGNPHYLNLVRLYMYASNISPIFQRRVPKFQEYLTTIQFFSVLLICGQIVASMINNYYLRRHIMKSIIKIRDSKFYNDLIDRIIYYYTPNKEAISQKQATKLNKSLNPGVNHQKDEKNL
jgi:hypothetical protein